MSSALEKLRSIRVGDYIEVLWGDACIYERVSDDMLKNIKPDHLDTPMRNVGRYLGVRSGRLMDYLVLWIGQDEKGHKLAIIPLSLIMDVKRSTGEGAEKRPLISHRFHRLHGRAVKIYGVKKSAG
ncbi:MAG: hypothetical protein QXK09_01355 [Nitrososphaerota archaeon]